MEKSPFYSVHKDFAQEGPVFGHEEFFGLTEDGAKAKYHELLTSVYSGTDPWANVYIKRDDGVETFGEVVDRRTSPAPEPGEE